MDKETLYKYFSQRTSDEDRAAVRKWVEESPEHMREFMRERRFFDALNVLPDEEMPQSGTKRRSWRVVMRETLKIASVVAVTLLLTQVVKDYMFPEEIPMQELRVPAGQQLNITLADGTSVWLNSKTTIKYPAMFGKGDRKIEIDGEGYFVVEKDEDKPFHVLTPKGEVEVTGTTFNVEAYSEKGVFSTSLIEGSVNVRHGGKVFKLSPNQELDIAQGKADIHEIENIDEFRWIEGIISLKDNTFGEVMQKFEKYFGVTIYVERKDLCEVSYTGKFYMPDGVVYALGVLQHDINFKIESDIENRIIYIK